MSNSRLNDTVIIVIESMYAMTFHLIITISYKNAEVVFVDLKCIDRVYTNDVLSLTKHKVVEMSWH